MFIWNTRVNGLECSLRRRTHQEALCPGPRAAELRDEGGQGPSIPGPFQPISAHGLESSVLHHLKGRVWISLLVLQTEIGNSLCKCIIKRLRHSHVSWYIATTLYPKSYQFPFLDAPSLLPGHTPSFVPERKLVSEWVSEWVGSNFPYLLSPLQCTEEVVYLPKTISYPK